MSASKCKCNWCSGFHSGLSITDLAAGGCSDVRMLISRHLKETGHVIRRGRKRTRVKRPTISIVLCKLADALRRALIIVDPLDARSSAVCKAGEDALADLQAVRRKGPREQSDQH